MKRVLFVCLFPILTFVIPHSSKAQLSGTYTIGGVNPSYVTLTDAVNALLSIGVSGPVTFNIRSGLYNDQVQILVPIVGASNTNMITFQSETGDSTDVTILFNDVVFELDSYIRLRSLTITSNSTIICTVIRASFTSTVRIERCIINSPNVLVGNIVDVMCDLFFLENTTIFAGLAANQLDISASSATIEFTTVNCSLQMFVDTARINNSIISGTSIFYASYLLCDSNIFGSAIVDASKFVYNNNSSNELEMYGYNGLGNGNTVNGLLTSFSVDTLTLENNTIRKLDIFSPGERDSIQNNVIDTAHINTRHLFYSKNRTGIAEFVYIENMEFYRNHIKEVTFVFIDNIKIRNNFIYDYFDLNYVDSTAEVVNNNFTTQNSNLIFGFNNPVIDFLNNNLLTPNFVNLSTLNSDYNNYWIFANSEPNSINIDPQYISSQDLHSQNPGLYGAGIYLSNVTIDIDSNIRPNPPTIGANEVNLVTSSSQSNLESSLIVYPNPATSIINVSGKVEEIEKLSLHSSTGILFTKTNFSEDRTSILSLDLSPYPDGIYLLEILVGEKTVTCKVILVRK